MANPPAPISAARPDRARRSAETIRRALALLESGLAGVAVIEALAEEGRPLSLSTLWRSRARCARGLVASPEPAISPASAGGQPRRRRRTNPADVEAGLELVTLRGMSFGEAEAEMGRRGRPVTWEVLFAARARQRGGAL